MKILGHTADVRVNINERYNGYREALQCQAMHIYPSKPRLARAIN